MGRGRRNSQGLPEGPEALDEGDRDQQQQQRGRGQNGEWPEGGRQLQGVEERKEDGTGTPETETEWELLQAKLKELEKKRNRPDRADDMPVSGATTPGISSRAAARPKPRAGR